MEREKGAAPRQLAWQSGDVKVLCKELDGLLPRKILMFAFKY